MTGIISAYVLFLITGLLAAVRKNSCLLRFYSFVMTVKVLLTLFVLGFWIVTTFVLLPHNLVPDRWASHLEKAHVFDTNWLLAMVRDNPLEVSGFLCLFFFTLILQIRSIMHAKALVWFLNVAVAPPSDTNVELAELSDDVEEVNFEPRQDFYPSDLSSTPQGFYAQRDGRVYLFPVDSSSLVPVYVDRTGTHLA
jgi:hypothetical protein